MNNLERAMAVLNYQDYDRLPIVHFAFWSETVQKWEEEGHLSPEETHDHNAIGRKLGFDFDWFTTAMPVTGMNLLYPPFEPTVIEELPDGSQKVLDDFGVVVLKKAGANGIPPEYDHLLKDRKTWEEHYQPRLQFASERINYKFLETLKDPGSRDQPVGIYCGSLLGEIRNCLGVLGMSYLVVDDAPLMDEIITTYADLYYQIIECSLTDRCAVRVRPFLGGYLLQQRAAGFPRLLPQKGRPPLPPNHQPAEPIWNSNCLTRLRRQNRCADPYLVGERRQYHVPDRGWHVGREFPALAREIRTTDTRRGRDGQKSVRL